MIHGLELRLIEPALREPLTAAHGETSGRRPLVVVRISGDEGGGWGECAALPQPGYTPEWAEGAFAVLRDRLAPAVLGCRLELDAVLVRLGGAKAGHPMAVAAVEQAVLDAVLRTEGRSLARWLDARRTTVPAGAVVGMAPDVDTVVERTAALVAAGFARVKVKIQPGWDAVPLAALRSSFPDLELQADANGSYRWEDVGDLRALERFGLTSLEQPLAPGDLPGAARLCRTLGTPVAADEAAGSESQVDAVLAGRAADVVVVKPARLGGLAAARRVHDRCRDAGVALVAGGLLEAGLGRRALAAVAAMPGFTVTGDCAPARRWVRDDPWPDEVISDGGLAVHDGPGIAPDPDLDRLDALTAARVVVGAG